MPSSNTNIPSIHLTSAIYNSDGTIKWADDKTKNLLFSKGLQDTALENYVFLFDCYRMRTVIKMINADCPPTQKNTQTRALRELYLKHIVDFSRLNEYSVELNGHNETIRCSINISGKLRTRLDQLN